MAKDPTNLYAAGKANDQGYELIEMVIEFYRGHRGQFSGTEATNVGNEVTNILNGTHKV